MLDRILTDTLKRIFLILLLPYIALGQDDFSDEPVTEDKVITVTGQIIDAKTGKPIAGANVVSDSDELGSAADEEGNFPWKVLFLVPVLLHLL